MPKSRWNDARLTSFQNRLDETCGRHNLVP
jgi:hypothetical protein